MTRTLWPTRLWWGTSLWSWGPTPAQWTMTSKMWWTLKSSWLMWVLLSEVRSGIFTWANVHRHHGHGRLWSPSDQETILSRLHIGHTYVTHSFLLKNEDPPWCFCCDAPFTVEHFLTECSDLILPRNQCFNSNSLTVIFKEVSLDNLFCFLKSVNLFDKI